MMRKALAIVVLIGVSCFQPVCAQEFEYSEPVLSSGTIPDDFRTLSSEKFEQDKTSIDRAQKRRIRKAKEDFYKRNNYLLDEFIQSGKVIFNDPVSNYCSKILDVILKDDPQLRKELNIYTTKSTFVNALTTNNGNIFINLGLIAQLENEAQLAYIICHEVIHYKNNHVINSYVENEMISRGKSEYRRTSYEDKLLAKSSYSKELELEADEEGLELFMKTDYSLSEVSDVFDVLKYSYLPFNDFPFEKSFFETEDLRFPESYFLKDVQLIRGVDEDVDDAKSTHPNIGTRRKLIKRKIINKEDEQNKKFIVSEDEFLKVRKIARYELSRLYLNKREYPQSLYNSYLLAKKYGEDKYTQTLTLQALYGISKYKNEDRLYAVLDDYEDIEGNSQQVYYFLNQLTKEDLNVLSLVYAWKLKNKYPEDNFIASLAEDLFKELVYENEVTPLDYFTKKPKKKKDTIQEKDMENLSKYELIKLKQGNEESEDNFIKYSFVDLFTDEQFSSEFDNLTAEYKKYKKEKDRILSSKERREKRKKERKEERFKNRHGRCLGIDKIVIVDPFFKKLDQRKRDNLKYLKSEASQRDFVGKLKTNAALTDLM